MSERDDKPGALVYIGRFQPPHIGHLQVVRHALSLSDRLVVLIGSAGLPRNTRNPWTFAERREMLLESLDAAERHRVSVQPLQDTLYDDVAWTADVRAAAAAGLRDLGVSGRVGLIGHDKDHSSYYLKLFPEWASVPVDHYRGINATPIREALLRGATLSAPIEGLAGGAEPLEALLPVGVLALLERFRNSGGATALREEQAYVDRWRRDWSQTPYPPTFVTVDALVTCCDHVLLIERGRHPGIGQWALPGGFLDPDETIRSACLRELAEETRLNRAVSDGQLGGGVRAVRVFDAPNRSVRGRTITHVHHVALELAELPPVQAADDAARAFWQPLSGVAPQSMFEDHYYIVRAMLPGALTA